METSGVFGLIRDIYPVSTIMIVLTTFGIGLAAFAYMPMINDLRKLLKLKPIKENETK